MTIRLYTGTPGSGKSLHMAQIIYWQIKSGHHVVTNFALNESMFTHNELDYYHCLDNTDLTPFALAEISRGVFADGAPVKEGSIKLFVDECQIIYNARDWSSPERKDWIKFFTQHRKLGFDVYLVAQYDSMIDKQIRSLVEYEVKHRKLNMVGWVGKLVDLVCHRHPVVCAVIYWYPVMQRLSAEWMIGTRRYYDLYDTYLVFDGQQI